MAGHPSIAWGPSEMDKIIDKVAYLTIFIYKRIFKKGALFDLVN